jgi:hypothetical protein
VARFQFYSRPNVEDDRLRRLSISGDIKSFLHNTGRINIILTCSGKHKWKCASTFKLYQSIEASSDQTASNIQINEVSKHVAQP